MVHVVDSVHRRPPERPNGARSRLRAPLGPPEPRVLFERRSYSCKHEAQNRVDWGGSLGVQMFIVAYECFSFLTCDELCCLKLYGFCFCCF